MIAVSVVIMIGFRVECIYSSCRLWSSKLSNIPQNQEHTLLFPRKNVLSGWKCLRKGGGLLGEIYCNDACRLLYAITTFWSTGLKHTSIIGLFPLKHLTMMSLFTGDLVVIASGRQVWAILMCMLHWHLACENMGKQSPSYQWHYWTTCLCSRDSNAYVSAATVCIVQIGL